MQATAKTTNLEIIKGAVAAKIDCASYSSWIAPMAMEIVDGCLVLAAQNQFSADYVNSVYSGVLSSVAAAYGLGMQIVVRGAARVAATSANDNNVQTYSAPAPEMPSNDMTSFDSFVASDENALVISAARRVACGAASFSPLFIYGPAGCGKTMITRCINAASTGRVIMMNGATFVTEFARSLHDRTVFAFKDFCRKCDTFIMDDVQALAGKRATMEEFLQLVMDLRAAGKNVVLTANVSPNNLAGFDRRVQSVLASGLVADMAAPNLTVRRQMLVKAGVATDVADAIAPRIAGDGHMVSGVITKIRAYAELMGCAIDADVALRLLNDTLRRAMTPIAMVRDMCEKLGVSYEAVCGTSRARGLVLARQTMMAVLKGATNLSLAEIGRYCGGRDHATVVYAVAQIEKMKAGDLVLAAQIEQMIAEYK